MPHSKKSTPKRSAPKKSTPKKSAPNKSTPNRSPVSKKAEATLESILILEHGSVKLNKVQELFKWKDLKPLQPIIDALNARYAEADFITRIEQTAETVEVNLVKGFKNSTIEAYLKKRRKLPPAIMETLAIIAYNQPVTKSDIQHIRGATSTAALKSLIDAQLIEITGYKDAPGKPALYRTTPHFLVFFSVKNIRELPPLADLKTYSFLK